MQVQAHPTNWQEDEDFSMTGNHDCTQLSEDGHPGSLRPLRYRVAHPILLSRAHLLHSQSMAPKGLPVLSSPRSAFSTAGAFSMNLVRCTSRRRQKAVSAVKAVKAEDPQSTLQ